MSADGAPCRRLEFDSAFFGFEVAQATSDRLDDAGAAAAEDWCAAHGVRCLYLLADPDDPATAHAAEAHGFRHVDVRVELTRPVPPAVAGVAPGVRPARAGDEIALVPVAREAFKATRFFADDRFDPERCRLLYENWLLRSLDGTLADAVLVGEDADRAPVGFVTCAVGAAGEARIGLFAVAAPAAGRGVGARLLDAALAWFADGGSTSVNVVTQARSVGALRAYERAGFVVARTGHWYHRWFGT